MTTVRIKTDIRPLRKQAALTQKKLGFATANAITATTKRAHRYMGIQTRRVLNKPTPFTQRAFRWRRATPRTLTGKVFILPRQFDYLKWQIYGGVQRFRRRKPVPIDIKLNKYGNIGRNKLKAEKAKGNTFSVGAQKEWLMQRLGGRAKVLVKWIRKAVYGRRFMFSDYGNRIVRQWIRRDFKTAVRAEKMPRRRG